MTPSTTTLLLDAALRLFAERGLHATPTSAITKAAGVSTGLLFHHFGGKEELILELYVREKLRLYGAMEGVDEKAEENEGAIGGADDSTDRRIRGGMDKKSTRVPVHSYLDPGQKPAQTLYGRIRNTVLATFYWMRDNPDSLRFILQIYPTKYRAAADRDERLQSGRDGVNEILAEGRRAGIFRDLPDALIEEVIFHQLVAFVEYVTENSAYVVDEKTEEVLFQTVWQSVTI